MTRFNDLPLELLPAIAQNVVKAESLASFCLVSKTFCEFTRPFLYHTIAVSPWNHKEKVMVANPSIQVDTNRLIDHPVPLDNQTVSYAIVFPGTSPPRSEAR